MSDYLDTRHITQNVDRGFNKSLNAPAVAGFNQT